MIEPNEQEEMLDKCCPLCGGKISSITEDLNYLEKCSEQYKLYINRIDKGSWSWDGIKNCAEILTRIMEIKLKMIEMGLIPK